jgi:hypothetical protein
MNKSERLSYILKYWPAAAKAQGWNPRDESRRRQITLDCTTLIHSDPTDRSSALTRPQVTALFTYLAHLADPFNITKQIQWTDCMANYIAFHQAKIADWHQRKLYGSRPNRLTRDRFANRPLAASERFEQPLNTTAAAQRLLTLQARHRLHRNRLAHET